MQTKKPKSRRALYIVLLVIFIGGLSFLASRSEYLKGAVQDILENLGESNVQSLGEQKSIEELFDLADEASGDAYTAREEAKTASQEAETAYGANDYTSLIAAQEKADQAVNDAEVAVEEIDAYITKAAKIVEEKNAEYEAATTLSEEFATLAGQLEVAIARLEDLEVSRNEAQAEMDELYDTWMNKKTRREQCLDYLAQGGDEDDYDNCKVKQEKVDELEEAFDAAFAIYTELSQQYDAQESAVETLKAQYEEMTAEMAVSCPSRYRKYYEAYNQCHQDAFDELASEAKSEHANAVLYQAFINTANESANASVTTAQKYRDQAYTFTLDIPSSTPTCDSGYTYDETAAACLDADGCEAGTSYISGMGCVEIRAITQDSDGDGLSDDAEVEDYGTDHLDTDTDDDGVSDYDEVAAGTDPLDPTNGIPTCDSGYTYNEAAGACLDADGCLVDYSYDASLGCVEDSTEDDDSTDTDGDGLTDTEEAVYGTSTTDTDTDDDGLTDYAEIVTNASKSPDPLDADSDDDGLNDYQEFITYKTDPKDSDSDDDLLSDYDEVITNASKGPDPLDSDTDDDGLSDYVEIMTYKTSPKDSDSDDGSVKDGAEVLAGTDPMDSSDDVSGNNDDDNDDDDDVIPTDPYDILRASTYDCTDPFTDTHGEWHEDIICRSYAVGFVVGRTKTTFVPNDEMTRAEWIKVMTLVFGFEADDANGLVTDFVDVSEGDWYYPYIAIAEDEDVIRTRDAGAYFYPNEPISRADALVYMIRMTGLSDYDYDVEDIFDDVDNDAYYAYALAIANETSVTMPDGEKETVIEGYDDDTFRPYEDIARSEAMAIAMRVAIAWGIASDD